LPSLDTFTSGHDELGLLKKELAKQRKLMPTRRLIASLPNLLPVLKPCMMMSPLSVSTYLSGANFNFDAVLFDEASQVRTEDAIGAIFRTKQVIIAGDSKQLPPTDFFSVSISAPDDEENEEYEEWSDTGAYESLLDEASLLPTKKLLWHYRSRHEHLIAFSNAKIYGGDLITFPSSVESASDVGVQYVHVPNGTYDRGGRNGNRAEAEQVAELVFEHFQKHPNRSLGVVAFGEVQQSAIMDALLKKRRENPLYEQFFREDLEEYVFIKNLETVQGDERDSIIFSIGYAPDATGKFIMNLGPLSRQGGERRLNVAVTRARFNVKLVGSILPTDIDTERTSGEGPKLLRLYLDFAINGVKAILGEVSDDKVVSFDSPFENAVYNFLASFGYDVATQVGCSGYRIDMAVRHPKYKGRYAIGIECDGASYHSARTARERDRLRQAVLEGMGWKIYRIWSTDWIKDPTSEGKKLIDAVEEAIINYREIIITETAKTAPMSQYLHVDERTETNAQLPRTIYYGYSAKEVPLSDFQNIMLQIISQSYGIDQEGLFKTTALCYGWQRRGDVIKGRLLLAYRQLLRSGEINEVDGKIEKK
jgi:very-short-patch-repair endonuclease